MKNALRRITLGSALSVAAMTATSMMGMGFAGAQDQVRLDHHDYNQQQAREYSTNRYYRMGNREGYVDYHHKTQRKVHTHKYRNHEDRQAHDYGYQQGWQGQSYSNDRDQDDHR